MANNQNIGSGNRSQAPKLVFNGQKENHGGFYQLPQALCDIVFKEYTKQPAYLKLMLVLCGTKPGFNVSEKWILDRTGISKSTYYKTRKDLEKKGWLTVENNEIIINYDNIYRGVESTTQKSNEDTSTGIQEEEVLSQLLKSNEGVQSTTQNQQNELIGVESTTQNRGVESTTQNLEKNAMSSSVNYSKGSSVNHSKEQEGCSVNYSKGVESTTIIYNDKYIDTNKLEYINYSDILRVSGGVLWINEEVVQLPNGKFFRVSEEERKKIDWSKMF